MSVVYKKNKDKKTYTATLTGAGTTEASYQAGYYNGVTSGAIVTTLQISSGTNHVNVIRDGINFGLNGGTTILNVKNHQANIWIWGGVNSLLFHGKSASGKINVNGGSNTLLAGVFKTDVTHLNININNGKNIVDVDGVAYGDIAFNGENNAGNTLNIYGEVRGKIHVPGYGGFDIPIGQNYLEPDKINFYGLSGAPIKIVVSSTDKIGGQGSILYMKNSHQSAFIDNKGGYLNIHLDKDYEYVTIKNPEYNLVKRSSASINFNSSNSMVRVNQVSFNNYLYVSANGFKNSIVFGNKGGRGFSEDLFVEFFVDNEVASSTSMDVRYAHGGNIGNSIVLNSWGKNHTETRLSTKTAGYYDYLFSDGNNHSLTMRGIGNNFSIKNIESNPITYMLNFT